MPTRIQIRKVFINTLAFSFIAGVALLPLALLLIWSLAQGWYWPALLPREWSLRAWSYAGLPSSGISSALGASAAIATVVTLLALLAAIPAARAIAWYQFPGKKLLLFILLLPALAPPLASAMGIHLLFLYYSLTDSWAGVILTHLIPTVPYTTLMLASSFSRIDPDWEAQARTLGATPVSVWWHITLPFIRPGLATAAAFSFLISWSQYLITLLIGGGRIITLPLLLAGFQRSGDQATTAVLTLIFIAPTMIIFLFVAKYLNNETI